MKYQRPLGKLVCLTITRVLIVSSVNIVSNFMRAPCFHYIDAVLLQITIFEALAWK